MRALVFTTSVILVTAGGSLFTGCATGAGTLDADGGRGHSLDAGRYDARSGSFDGGPFDGTTRDAGFDAASAGDGAFDAAPGGDAGPWCDAACPAGEHCGPDGTCRCGASTSCADMGRTCCGGGCVDVQSNPAHCGGCGLVCAEGQTCSMGRCVAATCTPACASGESCVAGRCMCGSGPGCASGSACCGGTCVRLDSSMHCGACGRTCGPGEQCCAGTCVDVSRSFEHCGRCGNACDSMVADACEGGSCRCGTEPACFIGPCLLGICLLP